MAAKTSKSLKFLLSLFCLSSEKRKTSGFTLIELLVGIAIGALVLLGLLSLVVDLLQTDRRESAGNETQREMQMALDYIANELREAVYVYDGTCLTSGQGTGSNVTGYCPRLLQYLPAFNAGDTPILAFWKPETIPDDKLPTNCNAFPAPAPGSPVNKQQECNDLLVRRRTYTLVVYLQSTDRGTPPIWQGKSRIKRYTLRKYNNDAAIRSLTITPGYVDPIAALDSSFQTWPHSPDGETNQQTAAGGKPTLAANSPDVLVDFVDDPTATQVTPPTCPPNPPSRPNPPNPPEYIRTPPSTTPSNSFFACVRTTVIPTGITTTTLPSGINQDVVLYLRGNANGRPGITSDRYRPALQTQVLVRGAINKTPN